MPIYKGREITMEEWYEICPQAKPKPPKPPMTEAERAEENARFVENEDRIAIEDFADAMGMHDLVVSMWDQGIDNDTDEKKLVDAFRLCADHIVSDHKYNQEPYHAQFDREFLSRLRTQQLGDDDREIPC